jgi:hypothetical protein
VLCGPRIDAIDEDAYRWLDAGIVRTITETADEKVGVTRTLQLPDAQRGHQELQVLDVKHLRFSQLIGLHDGYGDRYLLQCLLALRRGNYYLLERPLFLCRRR